ncbi:MAG: hypothetical protein ACYC9Z_16000 [Casimicrobiaceae bacterium]
MTRAVVFIQSISFERGNDMKSILAFSILAALLGGCAIVPFGYGDGHDGYRQYQGYQRGDGNYQNRDYNRGNRNYRDYRYRDDHGSPGDPFWQRGG